MNQKEYLEIPSVSDKHLQHNLTSNGKSLTLTIECFNQSDCNEIVRFLTNVIDEMTFKQE